MSDANNTGNFMPTLFDKCVGSLTSHSYFKVVRRDLRLIVLIREDLKV